MDRGVGHPFRRFMRKHVSKEESTSLEALMNSDEFVRDDSALLSLHPWIFKKESRIMSIGVDTSKGSVRSRRRNNIRPVSFTENYIAPRFNEAVEMEEYAPPNSPTPLLRPVVVSDGSGMISRSRFESFGTGSENGLCEEDLVRKEGGAVDHGIIKGSVIGVPTLPDSRKLKRKSNEFRCGSVVDSHARKPCKILQLEGLHNGMRPLFMGLSIGMISTLLLKRTELEKLNTSLKQTEDLVQDLKDELEMRDSLSVKELTCETQKLKHWNTKTDENWYLRSCCSSQNEYDYRHLDSARENLESLSSIEAELEAELEKLEQNMITCDMEENQNMADLIEVDPDYIADVVHGELRADKLPSENVESLNDSNFASNSTSTAHTYNAYYTVSPKELSIRLHQVIQARLEERIEKLKNELLQKQQQLQVMEAEKTSTHITFTNSEMEYSSNQESAGEIYSDPLCLNLSGDAFNAYDEVYGEFMKTNQKEEDTVVSIDKGEEWTDGYKSNSSSTSLPWESILWSRGSTDILKKDEEDGESSSFSDEEGKVLIQQLVEKSKQGSIDILNAQKMFLSMDEQVSREEVTFWSKYTSID